jgi:hypothetical protein
MYFLNDNMDQMVSKNKILHYLRMFIKDYTI